MIEVKAIPHIYRNKYLRNSGNVVITKTSSSVPSMGGGSSVITGNYLPATQDENGNYVVDISTVTFKGNISAMGEVSALGSGSGTSSGGGAGSTEVVDNLTSTATTAALSANQGRILNNKFINYYDKAAVDALITSSGNGNLADYYTKSEVDTKLANVKVDLTGYATETWVKNQGYITGYTLPSDVVRSTTLSNYSQTSHTHSDYSLTSHSHSDYSVIGHSHNISDITSLQTLLNSKFDTSGGTISGDLTVTGKIIAMGEVSAFGGGSGSSSGGGAGSTEVVDNLTSTSTTSALSANQGRVLNNKFSSYYDKAAIDALLGNVDVDFTGLATETWVKNQGYITGYTLPSDVVRSATLNNYSQTGHTHAISAITNLQSSLDGKSGTGHSHSNYSVTSHTHSLSSLTSTGHTHPISAITNLQSSLDGKSNTGHSHSISDVSNLQASLNGKSEVGHGHNIADITNLQTSLNGKSDTSHTHSLSSLSSSGHTHGISEIDNLQTSLNGKSDTSHTHALSGLSNSAHTHSISEISSLQSSLNDKYDKTGGTVSGNVSATGNITALGEISAVSDIRVKRNIMTLQNRGRLNPVTYIKDGKQSIGFIAQDVQVKYPEVVVETDTQEKYLSVNYPQITAILSAQINELYDVIDKLKKEIKELKNK